MNETSVEFSGNDLAEISVHLMTMSVVESKRSGSGGRGLAALYMKLADDLAARWLALDEGREPDPVDVPANALTTVDEGVLEEALRRLDEMQAHQREHRPDDVPWAWTIGILRGCVGAELEVRGAAMN